MLSASRKCTPFACLLFLLNISGSADAAPQKAAVFGTPTANLRAGAGVEHALKTTLKEGDPVIVEKLEGEWYLVNAADGQKGYVHKNLLKLIAETTVPPVSASVPTPPVVTKSEPPPAKEPLAVKNEAPSAPAPAPVPVAPAAQITPAPPAKPAEAKSQSILQMLEGHEAEVKIGLFIAGVAFVLGWFCGGSYYQRRERKSRYKLRF